MQVKAVVSCMLDRTLVLAVLMLGCAQAAEEASTTGELGAEAQRPVPAQLVGTLADPPVASLEGEQLIVYVDDSISGAVLTVPFTSAPANAIDVVDEINAVTNGRVTASVSADRIVLTSVEAGEDVFLSVYNTRGARILGLAELPLARGAISPSQRY